MKQDVQVIAFVAYFFCELAVLSHQYFLTGTSGASRSSARAGNAPGAAGTGGSTTGTAATGKKLVWEKIKVLMTKLLVNSKCS